MRAVGLKKFGGPEVLEFINVPDPKPKSGWVVVSVAAATVNPTDIMLRSGQQARAMKGLEPPFIPGMEFSGHVHALGDGVKNLTVGQPVMGIVNPRRQEGGAMSERIAVPATSLISLNQSADLVEAAAIPMNALTALKMVEALELEQGKRILVTGGAGGLGGYVIQLAKYLGLVVIADSKESDIDILKHLGADIIVPRGEGMASAVREVAPQGVDGLIDAAVLNGAAWDAVADGGPCVSVRGLPKEPDPRVIHHPVSVSDYVDDSKAIARIGQLAADGVITPRIAHVLPADQAAEGHRLVANGGIRGRVVLTF